MNMKKNNTFLVRSLIDLKILLCWLMVIQFMYVVKTNKLMQIEILTILQINPAGALYFLYNFENLLFCIHIFDVTRQEDL